MMSLNVARIKGVWYSYPIPEMKLLEREVAKQQPFGLKSSYIQEILLARYFREGYYLDIPGSEYDSMTR